LAEKGAKKKLQKRNADRGVSRGAPREPRLRLDDPRAFEKARAKLLGREMGGALREKHKRSFHDERMNNKEKSRSRGLKNFLSPSQKF
jgi:hypothetical protein